jgi:hypothetical protein
VGVLLPPAFFVPAYPHWDKPWSDTPRPSPGRSTSTARRCWAELARGPACRSAFRRSARIYIEDRTPMCFAALVAREYGGFTLPPGYDD